MAMNAQLALDYDPRKLARNSDPDTSRAAAHKARDERKAHRALILAALDGWPAGLIYTEIAEITHLDQHAVGRRISELIRHKRGPLVERAVFAGHALKRLTPNGCEAHCIRITDLGKQVLRQQ